MISGEKKEEEIVLGVIPARGGSKRVPKKNIKSLGGKPLIAWTIKAAQQSKSLNYYLVSTDADDIAEVSRKYGAPVPFKRPAEISEDIDSAFVFKHSLEWFEYEIGTQVDWVVGLQPTSPFRSYIDIDNCVQIAKTSNADCVISVVKASQHPFWTFERKLDQTLQPFMDIPLEGDNLVIQNLPTVFYPNGAVYVTCRDLILRNRIFGDKIYGYIMPQERSFDLETHLDFVIASALIPVFEKQKDKPWLEVSWHVS